MNIVEYNLKNIMETNYVQKKQNKQHIIQNVNMWCTAQSSVDENEMKCCKFSSFLSTTWFAWVWALAKTVNDVVLIVAYGNNTF